MKNLLVILCTVLLCATSFCQSPSPSTSKTQPPANLTDKEKAALCDDRRPEVRVFCDQLAKFQDAVNSGKQTEEELRGPLNNLDLKHARASVEFITVQILNSKFVAARALRDAGQARPDQQLGSSHQANGTTSLVSKAGSADLLALALDTGVLTRTVNGTTATLSANADQIFRLITGSDPDCTVTCRNRGWVENRILNPLALSASLDLAQRNSQSVATTGQASGTSATPVSSATIPTGVGKLSGLTARYRVLNPFDPRTDSFKSKWSDAIHKSTDLKSAATQVGVETDKVESVLTEKATEIDSNILNKLVQAAQKDRTGKKLADTFSDYFSQASTTPLQDPTISDAVAKVAQARALYRQAWFKALEDAVGDLFTFEYDYNKPQSQPITHDLKLIYGHNFQTMGMVTFNGAVSLYETIPAAAKYGRTHYGQVSFQYDRTLSGDKKDIQTQMSLAGYWQYQPEPSVLNIPAGTVAPGTTIPIPNGTQEFVGTAGSLWVSQAKFTIKAASGINIPIGVSWSNKTDLIQGSKVGAQVGISYNFSTVAGLFGGASNR
jgi:hypothetical protein